MARQTKHRDSWEQYADKLLGGTSVTLQAGTGNYNQRFVLLPTYN
ncbi:MAG: hypothetical protein RR381_02810 [Raoultibacter sp.]